LAYPNDHFADLDAIQHIDIQRQYVIMIAFSLEEQNCVLLTEPLDFSVEDNFHKP
jgi:hypothetical protein